MRSALLALLSLTAGLWAQSTLEINSSKGHSSILYSQILRILPAVKTTTFYLQGGGTFIAPSNNLFWTNGTLSSSSVSLSSSSSLSSSGQVVALQGTKPQLQWNTQGQRVQIQSSTAAAFVVLNLQGQVIHQSPGPVQAWSFACAPGVYVLRATEGALVRQYLLQAKD
jgi:hypothetical protein